MTPDLPEPPLVQEPLRDDAPQSLPTLNALGMALHDLTTYTQVFQNSILDHKEQSHATHTAMAAILGELAERAQAAHEAMAAAANLQALYVATIEDLRRAVHTHFTNTHDTLTKMMGETPK